MTRRLWLWLWGLALTACPPPVPVTPLPPVSAGRVHVRVFTEPAPVRRVGNAGRFVFEATDDALHRWDDRGAVVALNVATGLSGDHVVALGADGERKVMWILTDGGLGRYDADVEVYAAVTPPPAALGIDFAAIAREGVASLAPGDGGAWLGLSRGLFFVSDQGGWVTTAITAPVRALVRDRAGWLWIATASGLVARSPGGDIVRVDDARGCEVDVPRLLVEAPGDRVMVIGADRRGRERIALGKALAWSSYRTLPEHTWDAATRHGDSIVLMGGGRVYRIAAASVAVRPLARDGVRLVPTNGAPSSEWVIDPMNLLVPAGATVLGSVGDELLIGTRDLGTARYRARESHPHRWLRRRQMFQDATLLTVACAGRQSCWLATGAQRAWQWNGERFSASGPDEIVAAVARDPVGPIYALHHATGGKGLHLSRIDGATWTRVPGVELPMPGDAPGVSFARFTAAGSLWLGLRFRDGAEWRSHGIAIVEPRMGKVTYHRAGASPESATEPVWPIPNGVVDAESRGGAAWFATSEGVARLAGGEVTLWTEADGLRSELARGVAISAERGVVVATGAGAGLWDGKAWQFPPALRFEINDVVATRNGQLWMATERGIAAWDGAKVRRVDTRRGLAENLVLDLAVDQFDRVWARGPGSLTLISQ